MIIYSSWVAGAVLYTVSADDKDSYDVDSLEITMDDDISGYYMFDLSSCEWHNFRLMMKTSFLTCILLLSSMYIDSYTEKAIIGMPTPNPSHIYILPCYHINACNYVCKYVD